MMTEQVEMTAGTIIVNTLMLIVYSVFITSSYFYIIKRVIKSLRYNEDDAEYKLLLTEGSSRLMVMAVAFMLMTSLSNFVIFEVKMVLAAILDTYALIKLAILYKRHFILNKDIEIKSRGFKRLEELNKAVELDKDGKEVAKSEDRKSKKKKSDGRSEKDNGGEQDGRQDENAEGNVEK